MNPFKKLAQRWKRGNMTVERTHDGRIEMEQTDDYAGLHPDIRPVDNSVAEMFDEDQTLEEVARYSPDELSYVEWEALAAERGVELDQVAEYMRLPVEERPLDIEAENERAERHEAFIEASYDDELSLTDEATVMPGNLSYESWLRLAAERGVELDQLPEWVALDPVQRPLSPEAEAERDAREEAYVERQLREAYEGDAQIDPVVEAAAQALDEDSGPGVRGRIVPFEHEGERLYVRDHGRGEMQVLTSDEAAADPEWNAGRVEDVNAARLQAIDDDAEIEADLAMPRPPVHDVGGAYEAMWEEAERIASDRYAERVSELEFSHGCDAGEVRDDKERRIQLHQEELDREYELKRQARREAERDGIELSPF